MHDSSPTPIQRSAPRGPGGASRTLATFIFASRWLQAPLYLGLIIAQAIYVVLFFVELWHLLEHAIIQGQISETDVMLSVLALIDIVMIANLLIMVIIGGYETFVSRIRVSGHHDEPDWLSHVNANLLKIKLAISIISISSIHLLKTFIEVGRMDGGIVRNANGDVIYSGEGVFWEVMIHLAFIVSALALAWIDKMSKDPHERQHHGQPQHAALPAEPHIAGIAPAQAHAPALPDSSSAAAAAESTTVPTFEGTATHPASSAVDGDGYITVRVPVGTKLPENAHVLNRV